MKHIVSFSGGKDSTAMLLMMLEKGMQIDEIVFCDTGVEFPQMYDHIEEVKRYINLPITVLKSEYTFEYLMFEYVKVKGKSKGKKGYGWPCFKNRWCTTALKIQIADNYFKKYNNVIRYIGIAYDEKHRVGRNEDGRNIEYPLVKWEIPEKQALEYCYSNGFDWGGLYEKFDRVSCYLCPLQPLKPLKTLYIHYPELWQKIKEYDRMNIEMFNRQFKDKYNIEGLEKRFKNEIWLEKNQIKMF